jgi:ATP-dependent Clp protease ATP-binding subunit ClpA
LRLLQRSRRCAPRAKTIRPAEPYLIRGAEEARRRGHNYVGTEHVLLVLIRDREGGAARVLAQLQVAPEEVERSLACWLEGGGPLGAKIDSEALATLGIDFDAVRQRLEQTFGPGALEQTRSACLGIAPRLKLALAYALDHAGNRPLADEHVLLGMLSVPDSVAARALASLDVTLEDAKTMLARETPG